MPFIAEEIWSHLGEVVRDRGLFAPREAEETLVSAAWPMADWFPSDDEAHDSMALVTDIVRAVRNIRSKLNLGERTAVEAIVTGGDGAAGALDVVRRYEYFIKELGGVSALSAGEGLEKPQGAAAEVVSGLELFVPLEGLIDFEEERKRLEARLEKAVRGLEGVEAKLGNESFVERAPAEVVERERARRDEIAAEVEKIRANLADISG